MVGRLDQKEISLVTLTSDALVKQVEELLEAAGAQVVSHARISEPQALTGIELAAANTLGGELLTNLINGMQGRVDHRSNLVRWVKAGTHMAQQVVVVGSEQVSDAVRSLVKALAQNQVPVIAAVTEKDLRPFRIAGVKVVSDIQYADGVAGLGGDAGTLKRCESGGIVAMPSIGVVIPAWNEAARIGRTVSAAAAISGVSEVIVVDDGSTDDTADIAWQAGAHVLRLPTNRGKGQALHEGIQRCKCDIILMLDADLEETAIAAEALLKPVLNEQADMAIAQFPRCKPAGFGIVRTLAQGGIRMLTGLKLQSPLSGQRAVRRIIFDQVTLAPGWETEVALTIDAVRCGFRVRGPRGFSPSFNRARLERFCSSRKAVRRCGKHCC